MSTSDLNEEFPLARYLPHALDPQRTPEETVLGYIEAYQKWHRDTNHYGGVAGLRLAFDGIRSHFCTSRNRDIWSGWFREMKEALPDIIGTEVDKRRCCVSTAGRKRPLAPALRFHLERHAGVWRIAWLEAQYGRGPWALL